MAPLSRIITILKPVLAIIILLLLKAGQVCQAQQVRTNIRLFNTDKSHLLTYDMVQRKFTGLGAPSSLLDVRVKRGQSITFRVRSLNPLYRLKATFTPLDLAYSIKDINALLPGNTSPDKTKLTKVEATTEVSKLISEGARAIANAEGCISSFDQVRSLSRLVALDSATTVNKLNTLAFKIDISEQDAATKNYSASDLVYGFQQQQKAIVVVQQSAKQLQKRFPHDVSSADTIRLHELLDKLNFTAQQADKFSQGDEFLEIPKYWMVMRTNSYTSAALDTPLQVIGDQVLVKLEVVKRPDFSLQSSKLPTPDFSGIVFTIQVVRGLYMDLSAGLVFNSLFDHNYSLEPTTITRHDTVLFDKRHKTVRETAISTFKPGLVTLLHMRYKFNPELSGGLSGGVSLVADNKSIAQYHTGLSLMIGKRQRIVVTGGWSWGYVRRAAAGYTPDSFVPSSVMEVPAVPQYERSGMVSLTYNFTSALKPVQTFAPADAAKADADSTKPTAADTIKSKKL